MRTTVPGRVARRSQRRAATTQTTQATRTTRTTRVALAACLAGLVGLAGLAGCSTGGQPEPTPGTSRPSTAESPSTQTSGPSQPPTSGETSDPVAPDGSMADVVGPGLRLRSGGAFGQRETSFHVAKGVPFTTYAQVEYPAKSASPRVAESGNGGNGGSQSYWLLPEPMDAAYLRYWVRFPSGFDWVKGGKLPGFFGGTTTSGQNIPDGTDGFSTRYMWRADGAGEVYAYLPTSEEHGTSLGRGDWTWPTGRWACVEQHVVLNTPGRSDGSVTVWLDGRPVHTSTGLTYRTTPALRIDGLFFSTFFGGGDESWATPRDQSARFGGFAISTQRIGCR